MQISKGLATWAGIIAAVGQYALAIATFMSTFNDVDPTTGIAPLVTATGVLWAVIKGRMDQAKATIGNPRVTAPLPAVVAGSGTYVTSTFTEPRAGAETRTTAPEEQDDGDPDALPDYATEHDPPPDQGDGEARPGAQA